MVAYYKGLFKIHEVEIVAKNKVYIDCTLYSRTYRYNYLIRFKSGKLKYVHDSKIIIGDEE